MLCSSTVVSDSVSSSARCNKASLTVCPYVNPYSHLSTKSFSNLNEIWYVCRGQQVIHSGMPYEPIDGQGHGGLKFEKMANFKVYLLPWYAYNQNTDGELTYSQDSLNFNWTDFWYSSSFGVTWPPNLGCCTFGKRILLLWRVNWQFRTGAYILLLVSFLCNFVCSIWCGRVGYIVTQLMGVLLLYVVGLCTCTRHVLVKRLCKDSFFIQRTVD